ncbi:MAG: HDOD domain-containing protein [Clostridiales bacterium]|nr:HDOD domain-containing protein [Clostridiales bacterium]
MDKISLEEIINRVEDVPSLPMVTSRIMELTEDPDATVTDIEREILKDQGLTSRVLRLANSVYYGFPRRIHTISEATVLLGFKVIKSITLAATVSKVMLRELPGYGLERQGLWTQSQACAMIARNIARELKYKNSDHAYVAGLLHDIGKVILNTYVGEKYQDILALVENKGKSFLEAEREILGFDHGQVGARVAEKWNLPEDLVEAIAYHHDPDKAKVNVFLTDIIHMADAIVMMMGISMGSDGMNYKFSENTLKRLHIEEEQLHRWIAESADMLTDLSGDELLSS